VAKGQGELAQRILDEARRCGIPLQEDPHLAALLARIELGDFIPPSLYVAVAEVLAFAYRLRQEQDVLE
jgi:flagellar biosynthesis protein